MDAEKKPKDLEPTPGNTHTTPEEYAAMLEAQTYDDLMAHITTMNFKALIQGEEGPITVALETDENFMLLAAASDSSATQEQKASLIEPIEAKPYTSYTMNIDLSVSPVWLEVKKRLGIK